MAATLVKADDETDDKTLEIVSATLTVLCERFGYLTVLRGFQHYVKAAYGRTRNRDAKRDYKAVHYRVGQILNAERQDRRG